MLMRLMMMVEEKLGDSLAIIVKTLIVAVNGWNDNQSLPRNERERCEDGIIVAGIVHGNGEEEFGKNLPIIIHRLVMIMDG